MPGRHPKMHGGVEPGGVRQPSLTEQPLLRPQGAYLYPVLQIHEIWTNGSGSCYFRQ
jgi:hypothetical protein